MCAMPSTTVFFTRLCARLDSVAMCLLFNESCLTPAKPGPNAVIYESDDVGLCGYVRWCEFAAHEPAIPDDVGCPDRHPDPSAA